MLPLLSITRPIVTGMSSRLKTESFCSALSSSTRKFSCFRPSTNFPRSSSTVVWRTTRLTSTLMLAPGCCCPGGGGCLICGASGSCAGACACAEITTSAAADTTAKSASARIRRTDLVAWRVIPGLCVHGEWRQPSGWAEFDFDFSPARVVGFVAWPVSQNILISQLHANLGGDVRKVLHAFDRKDAPAGHIGYVGQQ